MPDLSWSHTLLVLIVALVVVGPKDLPKLMRTLGQWMGKARQMADQFRKSFDDMSRQAELDELRSELEALRSRRPFADIEREVNASIIPAELSSATSSSSRPGSEERPAGDTAHQSSQ